MSITDVADIRREYKKRKLDESDIYKNPIRQFGVWMDQALKSEIWDATAMTLATASADGLPTSRTVLLKSYDKNGFVFYTNYLSRKGLQLNQNPRACLLFYWAELERQVRIEGSVKQISREDSREYFHSRPVDSQIAALVSRQSSPVASRQELENRFETLKQEYGDGPVPMPDNWGGYRVVPVRFEFWQGRESRLHDRIEYQKNTKEKWHIRRLAP